VAKVQFCFNDSVNNCFSITFRPFNPIESIFFQISFSKTQLNACLGNA